jgi:hypothetical protein
MHSVHDTLAGGFPHSDIHRSQLGYQLPMAFRRFQRPSSPLDAKSSAMRPYWFDHTDRTPLPSSGFPLRQVIGPDGCSHTPTPPQRLTAIGGSDPGLGASSSVRAPTYRHSEIFLGSPPHLRQPRPSVNCPWVGPSARRHALVREAGTSRRPPVGPVFGPAMGRRRYYLTSRRGQIAGGTIPTGVCNFPRPRAPRARGMRQGCAGGGVNRSADGLRAGCPGSRRVLREAAADELLAWS